MFSSPSFPIIITILIIGVYSSSATIDKQTEREFRASLYSNRLNVKAFMKVLRTYISDMRTFRTFNLLVNQHCSCGTDDKKEKKNKDKKILSLGGPKSFYKSPYLETKSTNPFDGHILVKQHRWSKNR